MNAGILRMVGLDSMRIKGNDSMSRSSRLFWAPAAFAFCIFCFVHGVLPQSSGEISTAASSDEGRRWCMLTKELGKKKSGKWFGTIEHFPHSLEWYAECWSWLQEQSQFPGEEVLGGFIMDAYVQKKLRVKYWNRAFFPAMKFPVKIVNNVTQNELSYHDITTKVYDGGWFQRSDTCSSFRSRLWKNLNVHPPRATKSKKRRFGILNRNESRAIENIENLVSELKHHYPGCTVETRAFDAEYKLSSDADSMANQAAFFADKDVIIMAHGAAMSNVVFMRPGTAVLELFPRYYFNDMFWGLMSQCQIYHSWYYDGNETDHYTQEIARTETEAQWKFRMQNKKTNIAWRWKDLDHVVKKLSDLVDEK